MNSQSVTSKSANCQTIPSDIYDGISSAAERGAKWGAKTGASVGSVAGAFTDVALWVCFPVPRLLASLVTGAIGIAVAGVYYPDRDPRGDVRTHELAKGGAVGALAPCTAIGGYVGYWAGATAGAIAGFCTAPYHVAKRGIYGPSRAARHSLG